MNLLKINPKAAEVADSNGSLPLHLSLSAGKSWYSDGIEELCNIVPEALHVINNEGLTPIMIAAASTSECDLTTVFQLLR